MRRCEIFWIPKGEDKRLCERVLEVLQFHYFTKKQVTDFVFLRSRHALRVREHNVLGPYVDGLSRLAVTSFKVLHYNL